MKKLTYLLISIVALTFVSCENYLDRQSKTQMNDGNFWTSEANVRLFVQGAYTNYFVGYNSGWGSTYIPGVRGERSDDATTTGKQSNLLTALPSNNRYRAEGTYFLNRTGAGPWNFAWIRKWNLLLERLETMHTGGILNDEQYNHWTGIARFFRAYEYSRFVQSFGDVPYYDHVVASNDFDDQYKDRDPRTTVMTRVMEDLDYALANVRANDGGNGVSRVTKNVVAAYGSKFMLFEGTWYIYHNGDQALAQQFLNKAVEYAQYVMDNGGYEFDTPFRTLFGQESASGNEIIMYREYSATQSILHCVASYSNLDENQSANANLSTLKAWLCADGQPYSSSQVANVESWRIQDMVKTRDSRFEATFWHEPTQGATGIYCVKFIDRIGPWYATDAWKDNPSTASRPAKYGSSTNTNGFPVMRYAEVVLNWIEAKAELADKFGGAAVTQADLDRSINAIRDRPLDDTAKARGVVQTAHLDINAIPDDPLRTADPEVNTLAGVVSDPLIWEIRRERRMEFCLEQTRILDLRRWGKLELMQGSKNPDLLVGAWVDHNETRSLKKSFNLLVGSQVGVLKVQKLDGTIVTFDAELDDKGNIIEGTSNAADMVGFRIPSNIRDRDPILERNYLEPICTMVTSDYEDRGYTITQNPGW